MGERVYWVYKGWSNIGIDISLYYEVRSYPKPSEIQSLSAIEKIEKDIRSFKDKIKSYLEENGYKKLRYDAKNNPKNELFLEYTRRDITILKDTYGDVTIKILKLFPSFLVTFHLKKDKIESDLKDLQKKLLNKAERDILRDFIKSSILYQLP